MKYCLLILLIVALGCAEAEQAEDSRQTLKTGTGQGQESGPSEAAETEQEAVSALEKFGGKCTRDTRGNVYAVALDQKSASRPLSQSHLNCKMAERQFEHQPYRVCGRVLGDVRLYRLPGCKGSRQSRIRRVSYHRDSISSHHVLPCVPWHIHAQFRQLD